MSQGSKFTTTQGDFMTVTFHGATCSLNSMFTIKGPWLIESGGKLTVVFTPFDGSPEIILTQYEANGRTTIQEVRIQTKMIDGKERFRLIEFGRLVG